MTDKTQKLDLSQDELAVIEAALHTQSKILTVQAGAGGLNARARLDEVKRLIQRVARHSPSIEIAPRPTRGLLSWFGMPRIFG